MYDIYIYTSPFNNNDFHTKKTYPPFPTFMSTPQTKTGLIIYFQPKFDAVTIFFRGKSIKLTIDLDQVFDPPPIWVMTPETNIFAPENDGFQVRNLLFQGAPIFRGKLLASGRVI